MTGLERNSDIVFAASYAPLLQVRVLSPRSLAEKGLKLRIPRTITVSNGYVMFHCLCQSD